jgi:hypothetical protein
MILRLFIVSLISVAVSCATPIDILDSLDEDVASSQPSPSELGLESDDTLSLKAWNEPTVPL